MTDFNFHLVLLCSFGAFSLLLFLGRKLRLRVGRSGLSIAWERRR